MTPGLASFHAAWRSSLACKGLGAACRATTLAGKPTRKEVIREEDEEEEGREAVLG